MGVNKGKNSHSRLRYRVTRGFPLMAAILTCDCCGGTVPVGVEVEGKGKRGLPCGPKAVALLLRPD